MKQRDFNKLEAGIYEIDFGNTEITLAMIGTNTVTKTNWLAPINFTNPLPTYHGLYKKHIKAIVFAKLLLAESTYRMFKYAINT